jgi:4-hydroxybenzoate polyprenyltransferase
MTTLEQTTPSPEGLEARYAAWGLRYSTWGDVLRAHIRMIRPGTRAWFDTIMPFAVMLVLGAGSLSVRDGVIFVLAMNLVHIAGTILNDLQDAETDRLSNELIRRWRPIAQGTIPRATAIAEMAVCCLLAIALSTLLSWALALVCLAFCGLIAMHELPPLRTQGRPILGQVAGLIGLAGILYGLVLVAGTAGLVAGIPFLLFIALYMGLAEMLAKDIRDVDNDAGGGKITTAVRYGAARTTRMASLAYVVAALPWFWFIATYGPVWAPPLWLGSVLILGWTAVTFVIAGRLDRRFAKDDCRLVHRGSQTVFAVVNLLVICALSWHPGF